MPAYSEIQERLEASLKAGVSASNTPAGLYEPIAYALKAGGKRVRPVMALLAASLYSPDYQEAMPAALALEIFHNFTLLHDDIMDHSDLRRGTPSVQAKYGISQALLSGDAMFALAMSALSTANPKRLPVLLTTFSNMTLKIMEGQQFDMDFERERAITFEDYTSMIELKTAVLFAAALKMGATSVGAAETDCEALYRSGINIGIAFQLQDDYLDVYGDNETFGKPIGGDIAENKKTWLLIHANEIATKRQDPAWERALTISNRQQKFEAIKACYDKYALPVQGKAYINRFTDQALQELESLHVSNTGALQELKKLYFQLAGREI